MSNPFDWGEPPPYNETGSMVQNGYDEVPGTVSAAVLVIPPASVSNVPVHSSSQLPPPYEQVNDGSVDDVNSNDVNVFLRTLQTAVVDGYEDVGFEPVTLVPPPAQFPPAESSTTASQRGLEGIPNLDDSTARDALLCHVSQFLCFGLKAAKQMKIQDIIPHSAFRYELQTYTESRAASWVYEPYTGQHIDGESNGPAPKPWEVLVVPPHPFVEGETTVEVPRTASIQSCFDCHTLGRRSCWSCYGNGQMRCSGCNGTGQQSNVAAEHQAASRICVQCAGNGRRRCTVCLGPGQLPCKTCLARGRLKVSLKLTVTWKTHQTDSVVERTTIPDVLLRDVVGRNVFEEERPALRPVSFFPDESINFASRELLEKHRNTLPMEKIMVQRHSVKLVPVYQVLYEWRRYRGEFYVYGFENRVHFPDYPQQQCCGLRDVWPCSMC